MNSSKNIKTDIDDISKETQRLIKDTHVCLPYHKPKQKSLKDFLNRQKISSDCQASITGSKKLLQKAWEIIENKEQNVEQFYNEDCTIDDNNEKELPSIHVEKNFSLKNESNNYCNPENLKIKLSEISDDEENSENNSLMDGELLTNEVMSSFNDNEEEDSRRSSDNQVVQHIVESNISTKNLDHTDFHDSIDSEDESKENVVKEFIDDEAESSELNCSSNDNENVADLLDDSDDEFSKKKKHRLVLLSESSNDDSDGDKKDYDAINNSDTEINLTSNDLKQLFNETETNISTQQLLGLCSGQFQTQKPETEDIDQEIEDDFDSDIPLNDDDNISDNEDDAKMLKLTSAKDYFDDEAELSESDWSSDEEHLVDSIDKLEEEAGDKDKLDDDIVKDGLDKIYMRQLLDDDQEQVSALKEILFEDGELHSDFGRKRKFQWDEGDQNDAVLKKPLFSDNDEDDDESDVILSDDEKTGQWRKERFKRESYLSQKNYSEDDDINEINESSNVLQSSIPVVNKTHIVKYPKDGSKKMSNTISLNQNDKSIQLNDNNASTLIPVLTGLIMINKIKENDSIDLPPPIANLLKSNKLIKGSFMKRGDKMTNTLLFMNKKSLIINNDEYNGKTFKDNSEVKTSTITANSSNPFAYLLRNDKKPEKLNLAVSNLTNVEKTEKKCLSIPCTSNQSSHKAQQTKNRESINSILKQLE